MSIQATVWALKQAPVTDPLEALILLALADHAGDDGTGARPSQATIARYARCTDRTVRNRLPGLEAAGLIRRGDQQMVAHLPADRRPVVWDLNMEATWQVSAGQRPERGSGRSESRTGDDRKAVQQRPESCAATAGTLFPTEPSFEPSLEPSKEKTPRVNAMGTRLPDDWQPSPELVAWCREDFPDVDGRLETEKFRDYWHAKAGADARKVSWDGTFRNWIRNATRNGGAAGRPAFGGAPSGPRPSATDRAVSEGRALRDRWATRTAAANSTAPRQIGA